MNITNKSPSLWDVNCFILALLQAESWRYFHGVLLRVTKGLLDEILYFYQEEIDNYKNAIAKNKEDIAKLEVRISKANVNLYGRISKEIDECYERINFEEEELEHYQYLYNKFAFCSSIINNESNSEYYELIYTKS